MKANFIAVITLNEYTEDTFIALVAQSSTTLKSTETTLKNKNYIIENNAQRKGKPISNISSIIYNKDHGIIGVYTSNYQSLDIQNVKIKGPSDEIDETIKYLGVYTGTHGSVNADELNLEELTVGLYASDNSAISMTGGMIKNSQIAVQAHGSATTVDLNDVDITVADRGMGLFSQKGSVIQMKGKSITFTEGTAVRIKEGNISLEKVNIKDTIIVMKNPYNGNDVIHNAAIYMYPESVLNMKEGNVSLDNAHGLVFNLEKGEKKEDSAETKSTQVNIENVNIQVNGEQSYGVYVKSSDAQIIENSTSDMVVSLKKAKFTVPEHTVIYNKVNQKLIFNLSEQTELSGDLLLEADSGTIDIKADNSQLKGGTLITGTAKVNFELRNNSTWTLKSSNNFISVSTVTLEKSSITFEKPTSDVYKTLRIGDGEGNVYIAKDNAQIHLNTSLNPDGSLDSQKTDRVLIHGNVSGTTTVYVTDQNGSSKGAIGENGNTQGISLIQVSGTAQEHSFKLNGDYITIGGSPYRYGLFSYGPGSSRGQANSQQKLVDSDGSNFWDYRLQREYISPPTPALEPKQETVPEKKPLAPTPETVPLPIPTEEETPASPLEPAVPQPVPGSTLEPKPVSPESVPESTPETPAPVPPAPEPAPAPRPEAPAPKPVPAKPEPEPLPPSPAPAPMPPAPEPGPRVPAVVPQLPSYLLLPHALFHAGVVDMSNQHELLEIIHNASNEADNNRKTSFFIRGYGSNHRYTSNLSVFEHGYGADLDYNSMTAGVVLKTLENKQSALSFGMMGTYGRLSLQPLAVKQSQKSVFNKWSGKLYAHLQHDAGFYVNGFLSYDLLKGDVITLARGKTAALQGRLLSTSLMGGQAIITGYNGFIIEPQLQVIYQSIMFDKARDIDRFDIELGKHDQLIARVGGSLTKAVTSFEKVRVVSFYGKLHLAHSYEKKRIVYFKDAFQLGAFGSTVETGMGVHAQLSNTIALHGDLLYKHKLTKAGFSGTSISGGVRYQF
ncbi:autotransporter outer membrane beta-barrel domain-containing protein [Bartonella sp. C271]|uniref:autotransporter outer membrane beta-barrel domain-containing protein n=1 Tax=Bartonella sp. C271 TaxID=3070220 RepID=UPI003D818BDC